MERHGLRDDQFARIEHLLPGRPGTVGRNSESSFRRSRDLEVPRGDAVARFARTFWRLVQYPQAFLALGRERRLGESFQGLGERSRQ